MVVYCLVVFIVAGALLLAEPSNMLRRGSEFGGASATDMTAAGASGRIHLQLNPNKNKCCQSVAGCEPHPTRGLMLILACLQPSPSHQSTTTPTSRPFSHVCIFNNIITTFVANLYTPTTTRSVRFDHHTARTSCGPVTCVYLQLCDSW